MTTATVDQFRSPSRGLHISAWIVQGLLAVLFGMAGLMKSTTPNAELVAQGLTWVNAVPAFVPKLAGISEVLAAFAAAWRGLEAREPGATLRFALLAGLVLGVGAGVRLDVVLAAPCLALLFLFVRGRRAWAGLGVVVGLLPGLALLSLANHAKFGTFSPLSYGPGVSPGPLSIRGTPSRTSVSAGSSAASLDRASPGASRSCARGTTPTTRAVPAPRR